MNSCDRFLRWITVIDDRILQLIIEIDFYGQVLQLVAAINDRILQSVIMIDDRFLR